MASNRVERLQMRQRGAGTRKIKEVDFGFSLFGPPAEESASHPTNSAEQAPGPNPLPDSSVHPSETAAVVPPQSQPASSPTGLNSSPQGQRTQRTPGSARNKLPPRPSTFDIPPDEELELGRSSKRRKISSPKEASPSVSAASEINRLRTIRNGASKESKIRTRSEGIPIPTTTGAAQNQPQLQDLNPSAEPPSIPEVHTGENASTALNEADARLETGHTERATRTEPESAQANGTVSPASDTAKGKGRGRGRRGRLSPSQSEVSNQGPEKDDSRPAGPLETTGAPQALDASTEAQPLNPQREKRLRSRTPLVAQPPEKSSPAEAAPAADKSSRSSPKRDMADKSVRGRKRRGQEATEKSSIPGQNSEESPVNRVEKDAAQQHDAVAHKPAGASEEQPNRVDKRKRRAGQTKKLGDRSPETAGRPPRAGKRRKQHEPQEEERERSPEPSPELGEQQEPEVSASQADRRRKRGEEREGERERGSEGKASPETEATTSRATKKRKQRGDRERQHDRRQPTPVQEQPSPEAEIESESPVERESPKGTKRRRGKRPESQTEEQPAQTDTAEERPQAMKRKARQPRSETVPVMVHRIANAAALGGEIVQDESASEDDINQQDEDLSKQMAKFPTRSGVNPADVLAQICRETLEKTLTTLKNGIDSEANTARRQEWTLRKKAVEAFGTELEARLFELSEMLDSNFMLGVKVKKAKRKMMDLRSRLDQVRREREAVVLRMDAVRREHAREEHAQMARSMINHSLHNLDLALERGQSRTATETESLTAGLEFRLRNVAQNVSSTAPGAQGGILNQIKAFNAQLEATARQLEG